VISQATSTTVTGRGCSINTCADLGFKTNYGKFIILFAAVKVLITFTLRDRDLQDLYQPVNGRHVVIVSFEPASAI